MAAVELMLACLMMVVKSEVARPLVALQDDTGESRAHGWLASLVHAAAANVRATSLTLLFLPTIITQLKTSSDSSADTSNMESLAGMKIRLEHVPSSESKFDELTDLLLRLRAGSQIVVFVSKTETVTSFVSYYSHGRGKKPVFGDRTEQERQTAREWFGRGFGGIVVATHCAARELQLPKVTHSIVFDLPTIVDDFVACIECARTPTNGKATVLVDYQDRERADLRELLAALRRIGN